MIRASTDLSNTRCRFRPDVPESAQGWGAKGELRVERIVGAAGDLAVVRYFTASALVLYRKHDAAGDDDNRQGNPQGFVGSHPLSPPES